MNIDSMTAKMTLAMAVIAALLALVAPPIAAAQSQPSAAPPDADDSVQKKKPSSLDDLLGIEDEGDQATNAADAAARDRDDELSRELNETEIADEFELAIEKMSISADLLDTQFDPGLGTQRVQEDILAKLEQLIAQCKKNQGKSSSSSSSSAAQQQQRNPQQNPGNQPSQPQPPGQQRSSRPSDSREGTEPPLQEGDINTVLDETRSEWGNLPQRVRDALNQGKRDKYSSLYNQLTAEYYKRLAEEDAP